MPAYHLPKDSGSLQKNVHGENFASAPDDSGPLSLQNVDAPSDDSARIPRGMTANHGGKAMVHGKYVQESGELHPDLDVRSIPTQVINANDNPPLWNSGDKGVHWMDKGTFRTDKNVPNPAGKATPYKPPGR